MIYWVKEHSFLGLGLQGLTIGHSLHAQCKHVHTSPYTDLNMTSPPLSLAIFLTALSVASTPLCLLLYVYRHAYWPRVLDIWNNWSSLHDLACWKPPFRFRAIISTDFSQLFVHSTNASDTHSIPFWILRKHMKGKANPFICMTHRLKTDNMQNKRIHFNWLFIFYSTKIN